MYGDSRENKKAVQFFKDFLLISGSNHATDSLLETYVHGAPNKPLPVF